MSCRYCGVEGDEDVCTVCDGADATCEECGRSCERPRGEEEPRCGVCRDRDEEEARVAEVAALREMVD